jgi:hypothetical protein
MDTNISLIFLGNFYVYERCCSLYLEFAVLHNVIYIKSKAIPVTDCGGP